MKIPWAKAGCELCRNAVLLAKESPVEKLGDDVTGFLNLYICRNCGQFWVGDTHSVYGTPEEEAKRTFPDAYPRANINKLTDLSKRYISIGCACGHARAGWLLRSCLLTGR